MILHEPLDLGRMTEIRDLPIHATLLTIDRSHVRIAQSDRRLDERIKHSLKIEGRAADDLEHVGGGGLLLERFAKLVEQARILDGNHRLIGEGRDKIDLLLSERVNCRPRQEHGADRSSLAHERDAECGAKAATFLRIEQSELPTDKTGVDVNDSSVKCGSPADRPTMNLQLKRKHVIQKVGFETVGRDVLHALVLEKPYVGPVRMAEPRRRFDHSLEYLLQIERRATDHLEHVPGGGLLLQ